MSSLNFCQNCQRKRFLDKSSPLPHESPMPEIMSPVVGLPIGLLHASRRAGRDDRAKNNRQRSLRAASRSAGSRCVGRAEEISTVRSRLYRSQFSKPIVHLDSLVFKMFSSSRQVMNIAKGASFIGKVLAGYFYQGVH